MAASRAYKHLSAFALLAFLSGLARSQQNCNETTACSACIGSAGCVWCFDASYPTNLPRCDSVENRFFGACPQTSLENPENVFSSVPLELSNTNQVSLETVNLKLKAGSPETFTVSVKKAENFPLDLYILMDLSGSFADDLEAFRAFAPSLFASLHADVTTQFRVGFGGFVDKPTQPYSSISQIREQLDGGACGSSLGQRCPAPFSFEHLAPFTSDQAAFSDALANVSISASADDPEGTLEAMLQVTVCTDVIGWNEDARKVLLVLTDDLMHLAGDGSLAGINKPNDGVCRTSFDSGTGRTLYKAALDYDYPSVEQVRLALNEFDIFPVIGTAPLSSVSKGMMISDIATQLNAFLINLMPQYTNLVQTIDVVTTSNVNQVRLSFVAPDFLTVGVIPSCPSSSVQVGLACVGVGNDVFNFTISVTLNECTEEVRNGNNYTLHINVPGFDTFYINISGLCACDCAQPSGIDFNSTLCSGRGDHVCGVCECPHPFTGSTCECNSDQACPVVGGLKCAGPNRGVCNECGECECQELFSGPACECSSLGCDCSGQGTCTFCINGTQSCDCNETFFGENCQCSYNSCIDPSGPPELVCSGSGQCNPCPPNKGCICDPTHIGTYCNVEI